MIGVKQNAHKIMVKFSELSNIRLKYELEILLLVLHEYYHQQTVTKSY